MKRVWKITLWTTGILGMLMITATGVLYWKLTSMDLGDIRERHVLQADSTTDGQEGSGAAEAGGGSGGALPSSLSGAVSTADTLADKPIQSDDALDAAAILLQSGLSFREMYFLLGKSTDTLSTDEKQHIRDLLLAKLKPEEIESLRSITSGYGKHLVILDKDYPIEAVGVKDDAERDRIIYEYRKAAGTQKQQAGGSTQPPAAAVQPQSTDGETPVASAEPQVQAAPQPAQQSEPASDKQQSAAAPSGTPEKKSNANSSTPPQAPGKSGQPVATSAEQLKASYDRQLQSLKSSCVQEAERMLGEILTHLDQADGVSPAGATEQDLMGEVSVAEERCDRQYEQLVSQAEAEFKKAKLSFAAGKTWDQEYEQAKTSIRNRAVSQIQSKM